MRYAMQGTAEKGAGEGERRRDGGTGERAKEVAREEERRREQGTGVGAKEVARTAGGEARAARCCSINALYRAMLEMQL